jgi:molybdopterin-guanine dinucleotide biosynthesis protein MobB
MTLKQLVRLPSGVHPIALGRAARSRRRMAFLIACNRRDAMKAFSLIGECAEKSELVRRLVVELTGRGLRVSTIKRVSDKVDLERAGSGTWKQREAGAEEVMVASATRFALMRELPKGVEEPDLGGLLARMAPVDIVLLDGFRRSLYPKVEVVQAGQVRALYALDDPMVLAVTSDRPVGAPVLRLPLSDIGALADFVLAHAVP